MDLGAFLQTGRSYPVLFEDASATTGSRPIRGALGARRGRPFWSAAEALTPGGLWLLRVELAGFGLDDESALRPGGPDDAAPLLLAGRLTACRYCKLLAGYVLHVELMGRVLK